MDSHTEARVDLGVIAANVATLRERVAPAGVMAVVKADGYGHGAVTAARAALEGGAARLAVVHVAEALRLREAGINAPILCMMALPTDQHAEAIAADIELSASTPEMIARLSTAASQAGRAARVHLKADTGLSRGGAPLDQWPVLVEAALAAPGVEVAALWSHFAASDDPGNPSIAAQQAAFDEASEIARKLGVDQAAIRHLANTAAGITVPSSAFDFVRFGGGIYGLSTLPGGAPGWLRPAMTLSARLIQVKRVPAGSGVSYNHRYVTSEETTLGLVPLGYADGVPRSAIGQPLVWARGRRWLISGTVCMDQFVIDFGDEPVAEGDEVVLFGPGDRGEPTAQEWGERLGTISYEIATRLGQRVPRVYG